MRQADDRIDHLVTVRDWLRYAVSRFNAADLVYGHGTERAIDEDVGDDLLRLILGQAGL